MKAEASGDRLQSLDGIRAICIMMVIGHHLHFNIRDSALLDFLFRGPIGFLIFFVLSGYLITWLLCREEARRGSISVVSFWQRRALRILPVAFTFVFVLAVVDLLSDRVHLTGANMVATLTFTRNYWGGAGGLTEHLWSLSVQQQFFLLWPLIFIAGPRVRWIAAVVLGCLGPVCRLLHFRAGHSKAVYFSTESNLDLLMIGCLLGGLVWHHRDRVERVLAFHPRFYRVIAFGTIYVIWVLKSDGRVAGGLIPAFAPTCIALCGAYLIASYSLCHRGIGYRLLNSRFLSVLGVLSWGIYVWHMPFFAHREFFGFETLAWWQVFPVNLVLTLLLASASFLLIEAPLSDMRSRLRERATPAPAPESVRVETESHTATVPANEAV